jgi:hypothetical protein
MRGRASRSHPVDRMELERAAYLQALYGANTARDLR